MIFISSFIIVCHLFKNFLSAGTHTVGHVDMLIPLVFLLDKVCTDD